MIYFNENEPYCAQWLRNLYPGATVDERSVADVLPADVRSAHRAHFFAGIAGWEYALELAGWPAEWPAWSGSCPCQPFSAAGKRKGTADERHLWPEFRRLIGEGRPAFIFGEQVASADGREWLGGKPGLQRVRDAQGIARVLHAQQLLGRLPHSMQGMLQETGSAEEGHNSEGRALEELQRLETGEPCESSADDSSVSCEAEGLGVRSGWARSRYPRCHRCGRMRVDGCAVQSGRREDLGQSFVGPDRFDTGVHSSECACGAVLRQCDGESVGGEQDRRDSGCDPGRPSREVLEPPEESGVLATLDDRYRVFSGVRSDLEDLGYAVGAADLCAAGASAPHLRQRLYWVALSKCGLSERASGNGHRPREAPGAGSSDRPARSSEVSRQPSSERGGDAGGVADDDRKGRGIERGLRVLDGERSSFGDDSDGRSAALRHWDNFDVVYCRDGAYRRIEPGTFPLAHGVPAKVDKLRAYGNAIVPQVAAIFIRAVIEHVKQGKER